MLAKIELITALQQIQCGAENPKISTGSMTKEAFRCYFKCSKTNEVRTSLDKIVTFAAEILLQQPEMLYLGLAEHQGSVLVK